MTDVPTLATDRLILRGRTRADFPGFASMWADPEVMRFFSGGTLTKEDSWMRFCRSIGQWALSGYGPFLVEERGTGRIVGEIGPADYQRDVDPPLEGTPEFGWIFASAVHGRGYASEALEATLAWADRALPGRIFSCIIAPDNAPSLRLAGRFGFAQTAVISYKGKSALLLERKPA